METPLLIQTLLGAIAALIGVLIVLIGWIGNRIFVRMDGIQTLLRDAERGIEKRLDEHDRRITTVEAQCKLTDRRKPEVA